MPSVSRKQRAMMKRAAQDPEYAKARGVPQSVAKEYRAADLKKLRRKTQAHYLVRANAPD